MFNEPTDVADWRSLWNVLQGVVGECVGAWMVEPEMGNGGTSLSKVRRRAEREGQQERGVRRSNGGGGGNFVVEGGYGSAGES